jgi:magnesium chelatase subunit I
LNQSTDENYLKSLLTVEGLAELVKLKYPSSPEHEKIILMELVLHGLAEFSQLSKNPIVRGFEFTDLMSGMFKGMSPDNA